MAIPSNALPMGQNIRTDTTPLPAGPSPPTPGGGVGINYDPDKPVYAGEVSFGSSPMLEDGETTLSQGSQGLLSQDPTQIDSLADPGAAPGTQGEFGFAGMNAPTGGPGEFGAAPMSSSPTDPSADPMADPGAEEKELGYDPTSFRETVGDIMSKDSPEIQAARQRAKEGYGGRGMYFSDIAARGGEAAAMDKAMQMAAPEVEFARQQKVQEQTQQFQKDMQKWSNRFQRNMTKMGYGHEMEKILLGQMGQMMGTGMQAFTSLAMSPEATEKEVNKIRESLLNQLQTFTNIWKGSANSKDMFDFSGIA